jgi:aminoglycoside phosphotransferase (APT) family kinase protein
MGPLNMPVAEVDVDEALARRLLAAQFDDLARLPLSLLAHGWDTVVFRLGDEYVLRLPRRQLAADFFAHEQAWLGSIAGDLPLPVPVTLRLGQPQDEYPWAWSVCPWIPGTTADVEPPSDPLVAAEDLGRFLAALHRPAPPDAPTNPFRGVPLADRVDRFAEQLRVVEAMVDVDAVTRRWEVALAAPADDGPPVWIHGDLHPANLLVDGGRLSGVIDFVDLAAGDRATDLAVAWMLFEDGASRERFRVEAAVDDDATWARAHGWALAFALAILANSADHPRMAAIARRGLTSVLAPN